MKKLLALLLALAMILTLAACGGESADPSNGAENNDPTGTTAAPKEPKPTTKTIHIQVSQKIVVNGQTTLTTYLFDENNMPIGVEVSDGEGNVTKYSNIVCDEYGQILKLSSEDNISVTEYTYNENGNILTSELFNHGERMHTSEYTYNEDGTLASVKVTAWTVSSSTETRYYYENGLQVKEEVYSDGVLTMTLDATFDEEGRVTGYQMIDGDGNVMDTATYTYSEDGLNVTIDGTTMDTIITKDENGNVVYQKSTYAHDGSVVIYENTYKTIEIPIDSPRKK